MLLKERFVSDTLSHLFRYDFPCFCHHTRLYNNILRPDGVNLCQPWLKKNTRGTSGWIRRRLTAAFWTSLGLNRERWWDKCRWRTEGKQYSKMREINENGCFFLISSQHCKKKKNNTLYLCTSTYFRQFNLTSSYASYDIWEKISPWLECRQHEWKINTFNLHAEIAEKKKKHNIMLIIDKDIQFQYQQRAYCHDNVISQIFNPQVACRPLLSPSIWCGSLLSDSLSLWFYQPLLLPISANSHVRVNGWHTAHLSFKARKSIRSFN